MKEPRHDQDRDICSEEEQEGREHECQQAQEERRLPGGGLIRDIAGKWTEKHRGTCIRGQQPVDVGLHLVVRKADSILEHVRKDGDDEAVEEQVCKEAYCHGRHDEEGFAPPYSPAGSTL